MPSAVTDVGVGSKSHGDDQSVGRIPRAKRAAMLHFDAEAGAIVSEWLAHKSRAQSSESSTNFFKRHMYRLIKAYVDAGHAGIFLSMARRSGRALVGLGAIEGDPFKVALFAMWSDNESLTRHQQRVFGNQMMYAHLHDVPPEHLVGFIRTAGSHQKIAEKLKRGEREPGFSPGN